MKQRLTALENKADAAGLPRTGPQLWRAGEHLEGVAADAWLKTLTSVELDNLDAFLIEQGKRLGLPIVDFSTFTDSELEQMNSGDWSPLTARGIAL
jgi:hypothetical protein